MKRTAYAALACLSLALATYLVYRSGVTPPVHLGALQGPHYFPHLLRPGSSGSVRTHPGIVLHRYVVRPGDCLWAIGRTHHVAWQHLARANHVRTPYLIFPGQVLTWR